MKAKKHITIINNPECLNCRYPFFKNEVFCPECGQKNNSNKITLHFFINEVFKGFTSWDAKFWRTLKPLLIAPGKVTKDYIEGKRTRYTNPFRFYLTTSIIFFLFISLLNTYKQYQEFTGTSEDRTTATAFLDINNESHEKHNKDNITQAKILDTSILEFVNFQEKNPNLSINEGLDSLKKEKTTLNRFLYKKANTINSFSKDSKKSVNLLFKEARSYLSTAIFILLPVFALFLKLLYVRRNRTYIEHLIFVFHTQTVLFIILTFSLFINLFFSIADEEVLSEISLLIFLVYFFIAMKVFYAQTYTKTIFKFLLTTFAYTVIAILGTACITILAFILM